MRAIGLVPAMACLAGAVAGLTAGAGARVLAALVPLLLVASIASWRCGRARVTNVLLVGGFGLSGAALAIDARTEALHPPLRALLDEAYSGFAIATLGPEGSHGPIAVRLELVADAAVSGDVVALRASGRAVRLDHVWHPLPGEGLRLTVAGTLAGGALAEWRAGRTILAPVTFRRPARYLNAGVPDAEWNLALDGTTLLGSIKSGLLVEVESRGSPIAEAAGRIRAHVRRAGLRWVTPHDPVAGGIVTAILIGDRSGLPPDIRDRLQAAGTYHVIAISGGNIAILAGLVLLALMLFGVRGRPAACLALLVLLAYAQIVATEPSVWRATLMAAVYLLARLADHRTPPWQAVAAAAAIMAIADPLDVRDPGFLLSFGATAALLGVMPRAAGWALRRLSGRPRIVRWCAASLAASVAVELVVMPVSAAGFSRVTAAGLVLNLLAVPLMAVVQVAGLVTAMLSGIEPIAGAAGWIAYAGATAIVESARLVEVLPWLARRVPPPDLVTIVAYYGGLILLLVYSRARYPAAVLLAASMLAIVSGVSGWRSGPANPGLRLTVFDVGQGDSMLVEARGAAPLVVDTGGLAFGGPGFDIGRRVLAPALWAQGIRRVGTLLVTHADPDHAGGARALIDDFAPRRVWTGVPVPPHAPTNALLAAAHAGGLSLETLETGQVRAWGAARIRVLHPPEPDWERQQVRNDDSVVLEIRYGDAALLLTGDIGADVERTILPLLTPARLRVLKVAHHGSRTSTSQDLLDHWRPQVAVISAGRGNTFGHPTPEVLERLAGIGAEVFRTDLHGQITIETDGRMLEVKTFTGRSHAIPASRRGQ